EGIADAAAVDDQPLSITAVHLDVRVTADKDIGGVTVEIMIERFGRSGDKDDIGGGKRRTVECQQFDPIRKFDLVHGLERTDKVEVVGSQAFAPPVQVRDQMRGDLVLRRSLRLENGGIVVALD